MWTNAGEGEEPRGVHCRRNLGRRFYFHVTFQKLSWVLSGAPVEVGRRVGAGLSVWGAGWASFDLVSLDLRWVSVTFSPARDGQADAGLVAWPPTTRKGWG